MLRLGIVLVLIGLSFAASVRSDENSSAVRTETREPSSPVVSPAPPDMTAADFSRALLDETNRVRLAHGRRALRLKQELEAAADDQAAFMALTAQVRHESPLRGQATPSERVRRHGLVDVFVAENVAMTSLSSSPDEFSAEQIAAILVDQWLNSPRHRENLLSPRVTHFGGSVRLARLLGQWRAYGVQVFAVEMRSTRKHRGRSRKSGEPNR